MIIFSLPHQTAMLQMRASLGRAYLCHPPMRNVTFLIVPQGKLRNDEERDRSSRSGGPGVGQEPGRTWFILIERTGPPDGGPARFNLLPIPFHFPHTPGSSRSGDIRGQVLERRAEWQNIEVLLKVAPLPRVILLFVDPHPRRPEAGRFPARHAHTCHAPSGSARSQRLRSHVPRSQRLRLRRFTPSTRTDALLLCFVSLSQLQVSPSRMNQGMRARPRLHRSGVLATDPHSSIRDPLPSHHDCASDLFWGRRSGFGATPRKRLRRVSVPPDFRVQCQVRIPSPSF